MKHLLFILLFLLPLISFAQKKIGFDTTVLVGKEDNIYSYSHIKLDKYNNKILVGFFKGILSIDTFHIKTKNEITNNPFESARGAFLAKYDSMNNMILLKKIAESDTLFDINFVINKDCEIFINYVFRSKLYFENDSIINNGKSCINLIKFDSNLNNVINKNVIIGYGNEGIPIRGMMSNENDDIFGIINFGSTDTNGYKLNVLFDTFYAQKRDFLIAKFDNMGNILKAHQYGGSGNEGVSNITFNDSYIYIIGVAYHNSLINLNQISFNFSPLIYNSKYFIAKLDTNGNAIWVRKLGDKYYNNVLSYATVDDIKTIGDRVYITGHGFSNDLPEFMFEGGPNLLGTGALNYECFLACYDTAGNFKWRTLVPNVEYISELITDSNYNVIGIGSGPAELHVVCYDSTGNNLWNLFGTGFGALCTTQGNGIAKNTNGKLYVVGGTNCSNGFIMGNDTLYPPPMQSTLFFASIDSIDIQYPANVNEVNNNHFTIYPNPTYNELIISYPVATEAAITITNTIGQTVISDKIIGSSHKIQTSNIPNGIYFITIKKNQYSYTQKIIIHH